MSEPEICHGAVFFGRVHPERANVHISPLHLKFGLPGKVDSEITIEIAASQIVARYSGSLNSIDLLSLRNQIQVITAGIIDAFAWANGCGYTVEITGAQLPDGMTIFGVQIPILMNSDELIQQRVNDALGLILNDASGTYRSLRRALADFRAAMLAPDDTPFYCYRAVEALMFFFDRNSRRATPKMCRRLNIEEKWLQKRLEEPSNEIRHGKIVAVSEIERKIAFESAKVVIERFIVMAKRGIESLPIDEFPMISL
jgi:hypothetical protein